VFGFVAHLATVDSWGLAKFCSDIVKKKIEYCHAPSYNFAHDKADGVLCRSTRRTSLFNGKLAKALLAKFIWPNGGKRLLL
jgi:hypothetical protein